MKSFGEGNPVGRNPGTGILQDYDPIVVPAGPEGDRIILRNLPASGPLAGIGFDPDFVL